MSDTHHNAGHHDQQGKKPVDAHGSHDSHGSHGNHSSHDNHGSHGHQDASASHGHDAHAAPAAPKEPLVLRIKPITLPIAQESWFFIVPLLALIMVLWSLGQTTAIAIVSLIIGYIIFFFRDLDRATPQDEANIIAPADGKIIDISKVMEKEYLKDECYRVSIFMSLFDNHINRLPVAGKIAYQQHKNGEWLAADSPEATERNERNALGIETKKGRLFLVQVAGLIARRIVTRVEVGNVLKQGERFGLIMFGSRVDVYLPVKNVTLQVKKGQRVYGGTSVIGIYND